MAVCESDEISPTSALLAERRVIPTIGLMIGAYIILFFQELLSLAHHHVREL